MIPRTPTLHFRRLLRIAVVTAAALRTVVGCQSPTPLVAPRRLSQPATLHSSGLGPPQPLGDVQMLASLPLGWEPRPATSGPFYTQRQWRSPSQSNVIGVIYLRLPLPLSARFLVWVAKAQYTQARQEQGLPPARLIAQWTDAIGREWVDGENTRYHVRGYVIASGFSAWAVYSAHRLRSQLDPMETGLAARSIDAMQGTAEQK